MSAYLGDIEIRSTKSKGEYALDFISSYSYIDGAHHKAWLIDQVARILLNTPVITRRASWTNGEWEIRLTTGQPSKEYIKWIGDDINNEDAIGIPP